MKAVQVILQVTTIENNLQSLIIELDVADPSLVEAGKPVKPLPTDSKTCRYDCVLRTMADGWTLMGPPVHNRLRGEAAGWDWLLDRCDFIEEERKMKRSQKTPGNPMFCISNPQDPRSKGERGERPHPPRLLGRQNRDDRPPRVEGRRLRGAILVAIPTHVDLPGTVNLRREQTVPPAHRASGSGRLVPTPVRTACNVEWSIHRSTPFHPYYADPDHLKPLLEDHFDNRHPLAKETDAQMGRPCKHKDPTRKPGSPARDGKSPLDQNSQK